MSSVNMTRQKFWNNVTCGLLVGAAYVGVSAAMILSNKWLMHESRFQYPVALAAVHLIVASVFGWIVFFIRPSMFTAMPLVKFEWDFLWRFLPIAVAFTGSMVMSNASLAFCSVSLLQVLKQGNVVLIFVGSLLLGLERFANTASVLVTVIFFGVLAAALGEPSLSYVGLGLQIASQCFEVGKVLMQSVLISSKGYRLDPLTMVLFLAPVSAVVACAAMLIRHSQDFNVVLMSFVAFWPAILANSCLAFSLNVVVAWTIWMFNPTGFLVAGIMKDVAIILVASLTLGEHLSQLQCAGFSAAIVGISLYGTYKIRKNAVPSMGAVRWSSGTKAEKQPLCKQESV